MGFNKKTAPAETDTFTSIQTKALLNELQSVRQQFHDTIEMQGDYVWDLDEDIADCLTQKITAAKKMIKSFEKKNKRTQANKKSSYDSSHALADLYEAEGVDPSQSTDN